MCGCWSCKHKLSSEINESTEDEINESIEDELQSEICPLDESKKLPSEILGSPQDELQSEIWASDDSKKLSSEIHGSPKVEEQSKICALDESISRPSCGDEQRVLDMLNNNRLLWGKGFAVEVYSTGLRDWFPGKIIEVMGDPSVSDREVKVLYNETTKSMPIFSRDLRPLNTSPLVPQLSFRDLYVKAAKLLDEFKPKTEPIVLDAFISYSQDDAQDAVEVLHLLLKPQGVKTWVDHQQDHITAKAMSSGISKSRCFIIFLTKSYFKKQYPVFELETALALEKQIIVIWEGDVRCGGFNDLKSHMAACPPKYEAIFEREALKYERRQHLQEAQINKIANRISPSPENHGTTI